MECSALQSQLLLGGQCRSVKIEMNLHELSARPETLWVPWGQQCTLLQLKIEKCTQVLSTHVIILNTNSCHASSLQPLPSILSQTFVQQDGVTSKIYYNLTAER